MRHFKISGVLLLVLFIFIEAGCKKNSKALIDNTPANLTITANVSNDGSGTVAFTATATNAVTYDYEFGDGSILTATNGVTNYKYSLLGTNTFTCTVTAKSSNGSIVKKSIQVTVNVIAAAPKLVWSDEFNVDGQPNALNWGYDLGAGGWGNNELQYYTNRSVNAVVLNGVLKINAIKESFSGSAYTSARLLSKDKYSFKYGKVEVRAKIPSGGGSWPAIWMLGNNISTVSWPACGEIDIMEHVGNQLNKIYGTLHYPGRSGGNADGATIIIPDATTSFHNYILEWSPSSIKIYVDTQLYYTFNNNSNSPFNQNFFFILNVAIGGNFGGVVDPALTNATMEVDYVRVYQ